MGYTEKDVIEIRETIFNEIVVNRKYNIEKGNVIRKPPDDCFASDSIYEYIWDMSALLQGANDQYTEFSDAGKAYENILMAVTRGVELLELMRIRKQVP